MKVASIAQLATILATLGIASTASANPCKTNLPIDMPSNCEDVKVSHPIKALHNFREVRTSDARLKSGKLFRSDQLDKLSDEDVKKLSDLGMVTIIDLRAHEELETHPNKQIPSVRYTANLPIGNDPADVAKIMPVEVYEQIRPMWFAGKFDAIDKLLADHNVNIRQTRIDRYQDFATKFNDQISRYMHALTNEANFPLLFHCAGGKDRTGFVSAVTLLTLGYSEEDVMNDYLTTNLYTYKELSGLYEKAPGALKPAFGAHREQLAASLAKIKEDYGSFDAYRKTVLGISDDEVTMIKKNLLK